MAVASRGTSYLPATGAAFVHLLAYGTWLGALVWQTFIAGELWGTGTLAALVVPSAATVWSLMHRQAGAITVL